MEATAETETVGNAAVHSREHMEAAALVYTSFMLDGWQYNLTMREGATVDIALDLLRECRKTFDRMGKAGATPVRNSINNHGVPTATVAAQTPAQQPAQAQAMPPAPAPAPAGNGNGHSGDVTKSGTAKLLALAVKLGNSGKLVAEFTCDGMQYPLKDSRGPEKVGALFDATTGFTQGHFASVGAWDTRAYNLLVDWEQRADSKYRDVKRVYKAA